MSLEWDIADLERFDAVPCVVWCGQLELLGFRGHPASSPRCPRPSLSPLISLSLSFSLPLLAVVAAQRYGWMQWWRRSTLTRTLSKTREARHVTCCASHPIAQYGCFSLVFAARRLRLLPQLLSIRSAWRSVSRDTCRRARFKSRDAVCVISLPYIGARHTI